MMFGVLTIAVRIYHDRWGYGVYSGPIGTAVLIIAAKWVRTYGPQQTGRPSPDPASPTSGLCFLLPPGRAGQRQGFRSKTQRMAPGCPCHGLYHACAH